MEALLSPASMTGCGHPGWTWEENKRFESALAIFDQDTPDRWAKVAAMTPGKTVADVIRQYEELEEDVGHIEAGLFPAPGYSTASELANEDYQGGGDLFGKRPGAVQERKKGVPWTEEEHRRFLMGLLKHGKGDWRNISRNFVISKTPTQVASHAQKYFLRQQGSNGSAAGGGGKDKKRPSIHDITTLDLTKPSPSSSGGGQNMGFVPNCGDDLFPPPHREVAAASPHGLKFRAKSLGDAVHRGARTRTFDSVLQMQSAKHPRVRGSGGICCFDV